MGGYSLGLYAVNEQRARLAESGELRGVTKPFARVRFRVGRGIGDALVDHIGKAGVAEEAGPLIAGVAASLVWPAVSPIGGSADYRGNS